MDEFEPVQPRDPNDPTLGASSVPHLPPSNLEIKIRTMASDIDSIGKGGGFLGIASKISLSIPREGIAPGADVPVAREAAPKKKTVKYIALGVGGAFILFAVGYFLPIILSGAPAKTPAVGTGAATTTAQVPPAPAIQPAKLVHQTFFTIPPDAILPVEPTPNATTSLRDQWFGAFKFATGTITEAQLENSAGDYFAFTDFLSSFNVNFFAADILKNDFENDFTAFIYKNATDTWPGLILKLKPGVNALLVRGDIVKFEAEKGLINFMFTVSPGAQDPFFHDAQLSGLPVRELGFGASSARFVYGLTQQGYLIIASSEDAFKAALARL